MNKRGFTLIELIGVILLIGIISLILVPNVLKIVENSRKKAFLVDVNNLLEMASLDSTKNNYQDLVYYVNENKVSTESGNILNSSGTNELYGKIEFDSSGRSTLAIHNNKFCALKNTKKNEINIVSYEEENCELESVKDDTDKPTINSLTSNTDDWSEGVITITGKAEDQEGIKYYQFSTSANLTSDSSGWIEIEESKKVEHTYDANTPGTYYYYVKDTGGNIAVKSILLYNVSLLSKTYSIYEQTQKIPVVITNNNNYDVTGSIAYNGVILVHNFTVEAGKKYEIINVEIPKKTYDSLKEGVLQYLTIYMTTPHHYVYKDTVSFIKEQADVSIVNVASTLANDEVSYTEKTIAFNHSLSASNTEVEYTITLRNNNRYKKNKFRNITSIVDSNAINEYTSSINLADGIFVNSKGEYTFTITYKYDEAESDHTNRQILELEFKEEVIFGGITDHLIALGVPEYAESSVYGDFGVLTEEDGLLSKNCSFEDCYSDNDGNLSYDENGALLLDEDNSIATLNIDQSMSVEDEYSVYFTVKADTNQVGLPTKGFAATILAISESNEKYLCWVGFNYNYINLHSYYNGSAQSKKTEYEKEGFVSFDVSSYSNLITNIQITAVRGGLTKVYINGVLVKEFSSGTNPVDYKAATIGDLRPGRGLKFTGTIYDMVVYNKALSEEEVETNWNHAKTTWNIT